MSDFVRVLERDLVDAARRRRGSRRPPARVLLLAAAVAVLVSASAAAATLTALRGSPLPGPAEEDAGPAQTPAPGTSRVEPLRAINPGGGPPWAVRIARSKTGLVCTTVGQMLDGTFGLVGLDGRFRGIPDAAVDGCGRARPNRTSLAGARVLYARRARDVRTVINGYAGPSLRGAELSSGGATRTLPIGREGTFLYALRGYPEDIGVRLALRFADGHIERYPLGTDREVVVDPLGGHAWVTLGVAFSDAKPQCVGFQPAREYRRMPVSPPACGLVRDLRHPRGYWFAIRRIEPGGRWHGPARTAVWGQVGEDVREVRVSGPRMSKRLTILPGGRFLAVYPPSVRPSSLRVRLTMRDGTVRTERGDTNLVKPPVDY